MTSGIQLFDPNEAHRLFTERVNGDDWWVFIGGDETGVVGHLEERYYSGAASVDFEVMFGDPKWLFGDTPARFMAVSFARRRRLSAHRLAGLLNEGRPVDQPPVTADELEDHPLILLAGDGNPGPP